ncbi:Prestin [Pseudolycoriella hygida]|uniref:Prestin n=1 Tax=Pseudolycoriella hygida TaxID=35572 RepID=A0A9Q0NC11_9DIPT|nr:Prestin [Pseudolycoriella hygida]
MTVVAYHQNDHQSDQVLKVERKYYEQEQLNTELSYSKPENNESMKSIFINNFQPKQFFLRTFPIVTWLSQYNVKSDLLGDVISGCTVAVMHIPQGMGYALLANVPPILGIYTAFFPVLIYCIFGTSRHNSMGTFAVITIMVGKVVLSYEHSQETTNKIYLHHYTATEVATTLCLVVGIIQLIMYMLRLGVISTLLSETLVSGFTTGAAMHVFTSQVKDLLGIQLTQKSEYFEIINIFSELFEKIGAGKFNWAAIIISVVAIAILLFNNEFLKQQWAKHYRIPIPIELIVVVSGTLMAKFSPIVDKWNVKTIGYIPTGFPEFAEPKYELMSEMIINDAAVWIVTFVTVVFIAIDIGLAVGIVMSIGCIFIRGFKPYTCLLGNVPKTDFYLDITRYKTAEEIPSIKIYHYCGSLNFASTIAFKRDLCSLIGVNLAKETKKMINVQNYDPIYLRCLILDFSALSYIDPSGVSSLILLVKEFNKLQIHVFISGCSCPVYEVMKKCGLKESSNGWFKFFPTVHDAVYHAQEYVIQISVITSA